MFSVPYRLIYSKLFLMFIIISYRGWVCSCMYGIACTCMWEVSFMIAPLVIWQWNYMYWFDSIEQGTKTLPPLMGQWIHCLWRLKQISYIILKYQHVHFSSFKFIYLPYVSHKSASTEVTCRCLYVIVIKRVVWSFRQLLKMTSITK